jgi:SET domain
MHKTNFLDTIQRKFSEALEICGGNYDKLQHILVDSEISKKTIFDFDFSDPKDPKFEYNLLTAFNGLRQGPIIEDMKYLNYHPALQLLKTDSEKKIAHAFMLRIFRILTVNSLALESFQVEKRGENFYTSNISMKVGSALCVFGSLINHSCTPNVIRTSVNNKLIYFAGRSLKKGQQLFISYG